MVLELNVEKWKGNRGGEDDRFNFGDPLNPQNCVVTFRYKWGERSGTITNLYSATNKQYHKHSQRKKMQMRKKEKQGTEEGVSRN